MLEFNDNDPHSTNKVEEESQILIFWTCSDTSGKGVAMNVSQTHQGYSFAIGEQYFQPTYSVILIVSKQEGG